MSANQGMADEKSNDILARLQADDKQAFQSVFQQYYPFVCAAVFRFVKEKATVEDLAQDVFIKLWQKRHSLQINTSFNAYLRRMAINEAISYLRKNKLATTGEEALAFVPGNSNTAEEEYLQGELEDKVAVAINSLPERCRIIFQMSRQEGLTYKQIAEKLDISIKTVENQMGKALRILRSALEDYLKILLLIAASMWIIM